MNRRTLTRLMLREGLWNAAKRYGKAALIGGLAGGMGNVPASEFITSAISKKDKKKGSAYAKASRDATFGSSMASGALTGLAAQGVMDLTKGAWNLIRGESPRQMPGGYMPNPYNPAPPPMMSSYERNRLGQGAHTGYYGPQTSQMGDPMAGSRPYEYSHGEPYQPHIFPQQAWESSDPFFMGTRLWESRTRLMRRPPQKVKEVDLTFHPRNILKEMSGGEAWDTFERGVGVANTLDTAHRLAKKWGGKAVRAGKHYLQGKSEENDRKKRVEALKTRVKSLSDRPDKGNLKGSGNADR